jgi:hypothetical protein
LIRWTWLPMTPRIDRTTDKQYIQHLRLLPMSRHMCYLCGRSKQPPTVTLRQTRRLIDRRSPGRCLLQTTVDQPVQPRFLVPSMQRRNVRSHTTSTRAASACVRQPASQPPYASSNRIFLISWRNSVRLISTTSLAS